MDYNQYNPAASKWVGLDQFVKLFSKASFLPVLRNTVVISLLKLIIGFPIPVILALMMNEMRSLKFKKVSQTLLYLPHFISWVILAGIIMTLLDPDNGLITQLIYNLTGEKVMVLTSTKWFVPMLIVTDIYKGMGWGTILYFAAISGIDPQLYEAASIDGAEQMGPAGGAALHADQHQPGHAVRGRNGGFRYQCDSGDHQVRLCGHRHGSYPLRVSLRAEVLCKGRHDWRCQRLKCEKKF